MSDEIKEVITRAIQSARINGQRARIEGEYLDIIGCRILEDLHAAGWRIEPDWSDDLDTAPRDGTYIMLGNEHGAWIGNYCDQYLSGYRPENPWQCLMLNTRHMPRHCSLRPTHWKPITPPESE